MKTVRAHISASSSPLTLIFISLLMFFGVRREILISRNVTESILTLLQEMKDGRKQYVALHGKTQAKEDALQGTVNAIQNDLEKIACRLGVDLSNTASTKP